MYADDIMLDIKRNPLLDGVTFSGGEPFCQAEGLFELAEKVLAHGLSLWIYTGYIFEQLLNLRDPYAARLVSLSDVIIDGPFILEKRTLSKRFVGSENQRIIDVKASLGVGQTRLITY